MRRRPERITTVLIAVALIASFCESRAVAQPARSTPVTVEDAVVAVRDLAGAGLEPGARVAPSSEPPLPSSLDAAVSELRRRGDATALQRLTTAWSEAIAETMPHARTAAAGLASRMQPRDPLAILSGGDDAATEFFRGASEEGIARAIQPTVRDAIGHTRLADAYRAFTSAVSANGIDAPSLRAADLERAVTDATLHELFHDLASQEARIRRDPARGSQTLQRALAAARASAH